MLQNDKSKHPSVQGCVHCQSMYFSLSDLAQSKDAPVTECQSLMRPKVIEPDWTGKMLPNYHDKWNWLISYEGRMAWRTLNKVILSRRSMSLTTFCFLLGYSLPTMSHSSSYVIFWQKQEASLVQTIAKGHLWFQDAQGWSPHTQPSSWSGRSIQLYSLLFFFRHTESQPHVWVMIYLASLKPDMRLEVFTWNQPKVMVLHSNFDKWRILPPVPKLQNANGNARSYKIIEVLYKVNKCEIWLACSQLRKDILHISFADPWCIRFINPPDTLTVKSELLVLFCSFAHRMCKLRGSVA